MCATATIFYQIGTSFPVIWLQRLAGVTSFRYGNATTGRSRTGDKQGVTVEYYTLGLAAKAAGVSKTTISKAIANGKLSVVEKNKEGFKIDPSELHRVFPMVTDKSSIKDTESNIETGGITASLETEIRLLREMLKREQEQNQFLQDQLTRSTLLLESTRKPPEPAQHKGLFASLFGR